VLKFKCKIPAPKS